MPLVDALAIDKPLVINAEAGMMETAGKAALDSGTARAALVSARLERIAARRRLCDGHLILDVANRTKALHRARPV